MAEDPYSGARDEARKSLERMQNFNVTTLPRDDELGKKFTFREAVEPATRLIDLYKRLSLSVLDDLPPNQLTTLQDRANSDHERFTQILKFDPTQGDSIQVHQQAIQSLRNDYQDTFTFLHPLISYSLYKTADFKRLEGEARAAVQSIRDQVSGLMDGIRESKEASEKIIEDIRNVAAEHGVTQQAYHFRVSAEGHEKEAKRWSKITIWVAVLLGVYSLASLFIHRFPGLDPQNTYQSFQIGISKTLLFGVISYMLYLAARNFLSHKHNGIIDRHRQNALMTYQALVDAAGDTPHREIILVQAAACIFAPQGTGYTQDSNPRPPGVQSVVEFLSKPGTGGK